MKSIKEISIEFETEDEDEEDEDDKKEKKSKGGLVRKKPIQLKGWGKARNR